jgi:hypothetical protein
MDKSLDTGESKVLDAPLHAAEQTPFTIGFSQLGGCFLNGALDEVAVWGKVLTAQELGGLFARGREGKPLLGGKP